MDMFSNELQGGLEWGRPEDNDFGRVFSGVLLLTLDIRIDIPTQRRPYESKVRIDGI